MHSIVNSRKISTLNNSRLTYTIDELVESFSSLTGTQFDKLFTLPWDVKLFGDYALVHGMEYLFYFCVAKGYSTNNIYLTTRGKTLGNFTLFLELTKKLNDCNIDYELVQELCATSDNLYILEYVTNRTNRATPKLVMLAIYNNNLKIVKWLHKFGVSFNEMMLTAAISGNKVEIVKFIVENSTVKLRSFDWATSTNNLDLLQYLESKFDFTWTEQSLAFAFMQRNSRLFNWLRPRIRLTNCDYLNKLLFNYSDLDKDMIECVLSMGLSATRSIDTALQTGNKEMIEWFLSKNVNYYAALPTIIFESRDFYLMSRLLSKGIVYFKGSELQQAIFNNDTEMVNYLVDMKDG